MGRYCQLIDLKVVEITQIGIQNLHWKFYMYVQPHFLLETRDLLEIQHLDDFERLFRAIHLLLIPRDSRKNFGSASPSSFNFLSFFSRQDNS